MSDRPPSLPPLREVIQRYGLDARRDLGQHFLLDGNLTDRIARAAGALAGVNVVEVGPGPGGLTRSLLAADAKQVIAVEKDHRAAQAITELVESFPGRLRLVEADAMALDVSALAPPPLKIVANLPYNVSVPLLIGWLRTVRSFAGLTLMFQKEVAARLVAAPGNADYGRLSVLASWLCEVRRDFNVDRQAFTPPPKIMSTVVTLMPRPEPLAAAPWSALETVTAAAFGQRRKMLRGSLKTLGLDPSVAGIDPRRRAEELSVEEFCALAQLYANRGGAVGAPAASARPSNRAGRLKRPCPDS